MSDRTLQILAAAATIKASLNLDDVFAEQISSDPPADIVNTWLATIHGAVASLTAAGENLDVDLIDESDPRLPDDAAIAVVIRRCSQAKAS